MQANQVRTKGEDCSTMATAETPTEERFPLSGVDLSAYVGIGDLLGDRQVRLTYDRGNLEFMTTSPEHEHSKNLLGRLVEALTEELEIDIAGYGSTTFRREDLDRGLEPDTVTGLPTNLWSAVAPFSI
jgi:Uma2 family endonuclease